VKGTKVWEGVGKGEKGSSTKERKEVKREGRRCRGRKKEEEEYGRKEE